MLTAATLDDSDGGNTDYEPNVPFDYPCAAIRLSPRPSAHSSHQRSGPTRHVPVLGAVPVPVPVLAHHSTGQHWHSLGTATVREP